LVLLARQPKESDTVGDAPATFTDAWTTVGDTPATVADVWTTFEDTPATVTVAQATFADGVPKLNFRSFLIEYLEIYNRFQH